MGNQRYEKSFEVRWADLDPNHHLRHTAYGDYATHVRFSFLAENGFGVAWFAKHRIGPVVFREETFYRSEVQMGEPITVSFAVTALPRDGQHWTVQHEIKKADGALAAETTLDGAWLDLVRRKLVRPPQDLIDLLEHLAPDRSG